MANFESIVRPFQLSDTSPPRRYVTARQQSQPNIVMYFGRSGSGRTFSGSYSRQTTRYLTMFIAEDKRGYGDLADYGPPDQANNPTTVPNTPLVTPNEPPPTP